MAMKSISIALAFGIGLVVLAAVALRCLGAIAVAVCDGDDVKRHVGIEDFPITPGLDRGQAVKHSANVVDNGRVAKEGQKGLRMMAVDCLDVGIGNRGQLDRHDLASFRVCGSGTVIVWLLTSISWTLEVAGCDNFLQQIFVARDRHLQSSCKAERTSCRSRIWRSHAIWSAG
jgi:hypothetical protein